MPEFIDRRELSALLGGVTSETIRAYVRKGVLPPPISLSQRRKLWDRAQVLALLEQRKAPAPKA